MQHLVRKARRDADAVRDLAVERLGERHAVLVLDETGDLKRGSHTVGVQRHYTGTAGRIENAQVAVFATYATDRGHTLIDRELYLPQCWSEDPDRRAAAGVPDDVEFATKPQLAARMITRAAQARVPAGWVAADEVYGVNTALHGQATIGITHHCISPSHLRYLSSSCSCTRRREALGSAGRAWHSRALGSMHDCRSSTGSARESQRLARSMRLARSAWGGSPSNSADSSR